MKRDAGSLWQHSDRAARGYDVEDTVKEGTNRGGLTGKVIGEGAGGAT
jgi:hypothetical protein